LVLGWGGAYAIDLPRLGKKAPLVTAPNSALLITAQNGTKHMMALLKPSMPGAHFAMHFLHEWPNRHYLG
jgi:hypothetical protein